MARWKKMTHEKRYYPEGFKRWYAKQLPKTIENKYAFINWQLKNMSPSAKRHLISVYYLKAHKKPRKIYRFY